ncbi:zinc finger CCCH domain-containing 13 isoform X1 [Brachionus plicatilis]|uniref:Zinc finger CCCH domain-containing 13 isoform X1 n=1 Tax=Brachionus plicatilis TaxID=10195 RepID=A0A3M7RP62_BRAPC|nr:zinc finger CCCH domain-containing 13 isoform X1 [Brachionus plicatilis]
MSGKKSFYCWYLGFTEAFGLQGQSRVYEVIQNILKYHQNDSKNLNHGPSNIVSSSKVTLTLSDNHLTIIDNAVPSQRKLFKKSLPKAYSINYDKITYVFRLTNRPYSDIVTFITKSLPNESTNQSKLTLFLHAFRCDSDDTAVKLERYLAQFLSVYNKKLEKLQNRAKKNLALDRQGDFFSETGHLHNSNLKNSFLSRQAFNARANTVYDSSSGGGTRSSSSNDLLDTTNESANQAPNAPHFDSRPTSPLQLDFKNIKKELEYKLKSEEPILYPPKDYDEDDRLRGNLNEIHSRRSQNPSIIGKEAYQKLNASNNSLNDLDEAILTNRSDFTSASFNEQANQVLKMLDDVVNSEIANRPDYEKNIFEFKPPISDPVQIKKSFRTPGFANLKYSNMSASMESIYQKNKPSNFRHLAQKSSSIGAGLHDPYLDGNVKTNPLLVIEEEPQISSQFQQSMFKSAIDLTGNSLDQSANSSDVSTKKAFGQRKLSKQSKYSSRKSNQNSESHESDGFRPGVFAKLSSYQPQWLSSSVPNDSFYAKNEKLKQNKNFKLKYSESAKVNRLSEPPQLDFRPALSSKQKFYAKKNLPCVKEDKFEYPENSQFILKPYTDVNERYERDCENKVSKHRIRNNSSYYKSESSLANNNRYVFNDIYY